MNGMLIFYLLKLFSFLLNFFDLNVWMNHNGSILTEYGLDFNEVYSLSIFYQAYYFIYLRKS